MSRCQSQRVASVTIKIMYRGAAWSKYSPRMMTMIEINRPHNRGKPMQDKIWLMLGRISAVIERTEVKRVGGRKETIITTEKIMAIVDTIEKVIRTTLEAMATVVGVNVMKKATTNLTDEVTVLLTIAISLSKQG